MKQIKLVNNKKALDSKYLDIVVPFLNEEDSLPEMISSFMLISDTLQNFSYDVNLLLVNDGSTDKSFEIVKSFTDKRIRCINLSRNYGHQSAVWAGIENSRINANIVVMDCDGQDPIGEVVNICAQFDLGQDIIFMQRLTREDKLIKKLSAKSYYFILTNVLGSKTHVDVGDFYGFSSRAKKSLLNYPEKIKYIRGMLTLIGYNFVILKYHRNSRILGHTKYPPSKMFKLAIDGVTGFSVKPLLFASIISLFGLVAGSFLITYIIYLKLKFPEVLMPGWAFSTILFTFFNMLIMLVLGFISLYLSRIMVEIKNRPIYNIKDSSDD